MRTAFVFLGEPQLLGVSAISFFSDPATPIVNAQRHQSKNLSPRRRGKRGSPRKAEISIISNSMNFHTLVRAHHLLLLPNNDWIGIEVLEAYRGAEFV
jgi:hypothetical protein